MVSSLKDKNCKYSSTIIIDEFNSNFVDIYIDESGDLGFNRESSSRFFVVAALISPESLPIQRCFKKIRQNDLRKEIKELSEFKFSNSNESIKRRVFKCLNACNISIAYSYFWKEEIGPHLNGNHQNLYIDLNVSLISKIPVHSSGFKFINLVIDRSLYGRKKSDFDAGVISGILNHPGNGIDDADQISIKHVDSKSESCIQAVDFIAGAINRKYQLDETEYYDKLKDKMILELNYFDEWKNENR